MGPVIPEMFPIEEKVLAPSVEMERTPQTQMKQRPYPRSPRVIRNFAQGLLPVETLADQTVNRLVRTSSRE